MVARNIALASGSPPPSFLRLRKELRNCPAPEPRACARTHPMALPPSGLVGISPQFSPRSLSAKLLEVDESLLSHVQAGGLLHFVGSGSDPVVLTTDDATFSVLTVETSNSVFLCRAAGGGSDADGSLRSADGATLALEVQCRVGGVMQVGGWGVWQGTSSGCCAHNTFPTRPIPPFAPSALPDEPFHAAPSRSPPALGPLHGPSGASEGGRGRGPHRR